MPFLGPEPQIFPSDLLSGGCDGGGDRHWWVVHTKSRQEKSVARELLNHAIPYFLPQTEKTSFVRGRKRRVFVPVFSGYVFLFGDEMERYRTLSTHRTAQVIAVEDQEQLRQDLVGIWRMIDAKVPMTTEGRLAPGDPVRVRSGVLAGVEGVVTSRKNKCRLLVAVRLLQQGVSVEIDDFMLEPI